MKNRKIITTLLILMLAIISISVVSAAEINSPITDFQNNIGQVNEDILSDPNNNTNSDDNTTDDENPAEDDNTTDDENYTDDEYDIDENINNTYDDLLNKITSAKGSATGREITDTISENDNNLPPTGNPLILLLALVIIVVPTLIKREK